MVNSTTNLQTRVKWLQWSIPVGLFMLSATYQLGPARWVHDNYHETAHFLVEILMYGFIGPSIVYFAFNNVRQWLSEKEQAEYLARQTERKLISITEASADAIIGLMLDGTIESWNRGAQLIIGYADEAIRKIPFQQLLENTEKSDAEWRWLTDTVRQDGFIRGYQTWIRQEGGVPVIVELTATLMADEQEDPVGYSIVLRDITERKKREEENNQLNNHLNDLVIERTRELDERLDELAQANDQLKQLDQTRAEFVSVVSHQIRAPLTNIRGAVEKMQSASSQPDEMLGIIEQQAERLDRLVRDVLSADKIEAGNLILQTEPTSLLPLIQEAVAQFQARDRSHNIDWPSDALPLVEADADRVLEVLANLLDNASKYSHSGSEILISAREKASQVTLSIRDCGNGILPDDLPRIFEKFYRADGSDSQMAYGYGLGLYICRQLVEAMGGRIWAENHAEGGAVLSFSLPRWQEPND